MAVKKYGVTLAPGVQVVEKEGAPVYQPAALGGTVVMGPFSRGAVSTAAAPKINKCPTYRVFNRKMGGRLAGYLTPDAAQDFWEYGGGAGYLYAIRLTDGTEEKAELTVYSRHWGTGFYSPESEKDNQSQIKIPLLKIKAKNGGRWGGRKRLLSAEAASSGSITATTLTTGITMLENEYAGATLTFAGITGKSYEVVSNTTAGVITVKSGVSMTQDYTDSGTSSLRYQLDLANKTLKTGGREALSVKFGPGVQDAANNFSMLVKVDGQIVAKLDDLSMDPTSDYYIANVVSGLDALESNDEIEIEDLISSSGYAYSADLRPANFYAMPKTVTATRATFVPGFVKSVSDTTNIKIVKIEGTSVRAVPHRLTFTWVSASNYYTVAATETANGQALKNLSNFSVGNGAQYAKEWDPGALPTVKVTVDHPSEPANGETFVIDVVPVESLMVGGEIYPDAKGSTVSKLLVSAISTDGSNYVDITTGDLSTLGLTPAQASVTCSNAGTYNIGSGSSDAMKISIDGRASITVTLTSGSARTAAQIVTDINAAFDATFGSGVLNPASVVDNKVKLASTWYEGGGAGSSVKIETVSNNAYTVLGFTVGTTYGTDGKEMMISYDQELSGGHDGGAPADAKYLDAMSVDSSPLNQLAGLGAGQLTLLTPDKTSTTVQQRGQAFASERAYQYLAMIPAATTSEQGAVDYVQSTLGYGNHSAVFFPSYTYVRDPDKEGPLKLVPVTGAIAGLMAAKARANGHYSEPPAGLGAKLVKTVSLPTGDSPLNLELLAPARINGLKRTGGNWVVWGSSALSENAQALQDWSVRCQLNHYIRWALDNLDWILFRLNDPELWLEAQVFIETFFLGEWKNGKGPLLGNEPKKAFSVKIDEENNPPSSVEAGDINAEIQLSLKKVVRRVIVSLSRDGVNEANA